MIEAPAAITGLRRVNFWATTAIYDQGHSAWFQVQRAGGPNVIPFIPGTDARWDPWHGSHNGKGLTEDSGDNVTRMVLNQDFTSGLTQTGPLLDHFPDLSPPPES
jgi:hypothetical protein